MDRTADSLLQYEDKILLLLTLIIGAVVGLVVAAFIYVTENLGARMYPAGSAAWRRVLIPTGGALFTGYLLSRFFPQRPRQRHPADQGGAVSARRLHQPAHRARQVRLLLGVARQRHRAGPRRSVGASGRGNRVGAGTAAWAWARTGFAS